jgi:hypothetical protein
MGIFDRFKKRESEVSDLERLSALAGDPEALDEIEDEELKQLIMVKCIEYGICQDGSLIPQLFGLYRYAMDRLDVSDRTQLVSQYSQFVEDREGEGHMGLMMFLAADTNAAIRSTAALSLSVLFEPEDGNELAGPEFVVRTLLNQEDGTSSQGEALGGVLLLGDRRLLPLLESAWEQLTEEAQLGLTRCKSGFVSEGIVEFWLRCLEKGCSEAVYGSVVAALAKMPVIAQVPVVIDMERVLPAYAEPENPMKMLRQTSFEDYLDEIQPRLEALERTESEPKLITQIFAMWKDPDSYAGLVG